MSYLVLARKWRPQGFDDLVGQEPITRILRNALSQGKTSHAYIFSGPRGVGKTTTARILAKALNCSGGEAASPCGRCASCVSIADGSSVDVIEIDGASNNSVDDIRDLRERVKYAPSGGKFKVYIIDEAHMLSTSAFNALLKTLEEPPPHVIFVLATTEMRKIPATVLSRCQHMPFRRIPSSVIRERLKRIVESEDIKAAPHALGLIARAADGSMRDSLTILDQIAAFSSEITEADVHSLLGIEDFAVFRDLGGAVIRGNRAGILEMINELAERGTDFRSFAKDLVQFFRDLLVAGIVENPAETLDLADEELAAIGELASSAPEDQLALLLSEMVKAEGDVRSAASPRLSLEMALIRISFIGTMRPIKEIIERVERLRVEDAPVPLPPPSPKEKAPEEARPAEEAPDTPSAVAPAEMALSAEDWEEAGDEEEQPIQEEPAEKNWDLAYVWKKTLERLDARLSSKIAHAGLDLQGDELRLTLNGGQSVFEEAVKGNIREIERILLQESGSKIRVTLATAQKKGPRKRDLKDKALKEPLVKEALELFDGRIVDVVSVENGENTLNGGEDV